MPKIPPVVAKNIAGMIKAMDIPIEPNMIFMVGALFFMLYPFQQSNL